MGQPISEIPEGGGFLILFYPTEDSPEVQEGQLLHIVGGGDLREPVALVKATGGQHKGELYSVGISRLVTRKMP